MKASTLAVGTEVVDGQITDRNSAWLSERASEAGIEMIEHRAVPDDRVKIAQALRDLSETSDLLFVTGGLGPTSDDFTRDLVAEVYGLPLEFDEGSWQKIVKRFEARGAQAKPMQRQQCYFPKTAQVLENPAGTANAFSLAVKWNGRPLEIFVLPGPPVEVTTVWDLHLVRRMTTLVPPEQRDDLHLWQTLGLGEGDIAEKVEVAIAGSGLRVGYRVHPPYVEVKLWVPRAKAVDFKRVVEAVETALNPWIAVRGKQDIAACFARAAFEGHDIRVLDHVTGGYVHARLFESLANFRKANPDLEAKGSLQVTTALLGSPRDEAEAGGSIQISLLEDRENKQWVVKMTGLESQTLAVQPTSLYNFGSERGHKYMAEKMFHALSRLAPFAAEKPNQKPNGKT